MNTYVIKRTGRRCSPFLVVLEDGSKLRLKATGSHVADLSEADVASVRKLPDVELILVPALAPEPSPEAPTDEKPKKRRAR